MDCAKSIPSTNEETSRETKPAAKVLATNYLANFIHNDHPLNKRQEINNTDKRGLVILPYAKGISEKVAEI